MIRVINACIDKDVEGSYEYMNQMILDGYTISDIIDTFSSSIKKYDMDPELKLRFMTEIGSVHVRIVMGLATKTQMVGLLARLCKL